jgi:hypothetical protein
MAISISQDPQDYDISGNPLVWVFSSDKTAQSNFSYRVELSVDGVIQESHEILPENGTAAHFDCSDIAERYANSPAVDDAQVYDAADTILLKLEVFENYGTPPIDVLSATSTYTIVKGRLSKRNFTSYDPTQYVFNGGGADLWATLYPRTETRYINLANNNKFSFITNSLTLKLTVDLYNTGGLIASATSPDVAQAKTTTANINSTTLVTDWGFTSGNVTATTYMDIYWSSTGLGSDSEKLRLTIDDRCYSTSARHLVFMASNGFLEPYTFIKRSKEKTKIKSFGYEQQYGYFDNAGTYSFSEGGVGDYVKQLENSLSVQSDWVAEDEYNFLTKELLTSPMVFLQQDGELIRVKVTARSFEEKTNENEMVFNLKVDLHTTNDLSTLL